MRIFRLLAENIQRLSAVEIVPDESAVVVLAGENENGKSSCLDAIEMALGGKDALPPEPVRRGAAKARVVVDLGDIIVTRNFKADGGSSLTVTNRDGAKYPSPQALVDGFRSKLTFDPLVFASAKPAEQSAILRALAGVDTSDLEEQRAEVYNERTLLNRDVTQMKAALKQSPEYPDVTGPIALEDVTAALEAADVAADQAVAADAALAKATARVQAVGARIETAERALADARAAVEAAEMELDAARLAETELADDQRQARELRDESAAKVPDRTALRQQLVDANTHNEKHAANMRRREQAQRAEAVQKKADDLTARINALDAEKVDRLAKATFPLDGLSLGPDGGVTWNGMPFEQASTAVRTRVSVAIGFALHPKLKVLLVRNGNDLDAKSLKLIAELAAEHGGQLWLERIAGGNGLQTIVIEDGAVKPAEAVA